MEQKSTEELEIDFSMGQYSTFLENILNKFGIEITIDSKESLLEAHQRYLQLSFEQFYEHDNFEEFNRYQQLQKQMITYLVKDDHTVFLSGENEVLLTQSAKEDDKYQITFFDQRGAMSDKILDSLDGSINYLIENNIIPMKEEYVEFLSNQGVLRMTQQNNEHKTGGKQMGYEIEARKTLIGNYVVSAEKLENAQEKVDQLEEVKNQLINKIQDLEGQLNDTQVKLENANRENEEQFTDLSSEVYPKLEDLGNLRDRLYTKIESISKAFPGVSDYSKAYDELSNYRDKSHLERFNPYDAYEGQEWKFMQEKDVSQIALYGSEVVATFVKEGKTELPTERNDIKAELYIESDTYDNLENNPHLINLKYHELRVVVIDQNSNKEKLSLVEFENKFEGAISHLKSEHEKTIIPQGKKSLNGRLNQLIETKKEPIEHPKEAKEVSR